MKPQELKDLLAKLKEHYVFYEEAIDLIMNKYSTKGSAKTNLDNWIKDGTVERVITYNMPNLYNKKDILTKVNK